VILTPEHKRLGLQSPHLKVMRLTIVSYISLPSVTMALEQEYAFLGQNKSKAVGKKMNVEIITEPQELMELGISADEILIQKLFSCKVFTVGTIGIGFRGVYNNRKFIIGHSHITERSDGGGLMGAMMGVKSSIIRDYHTYSLKMATNIGGSALDGITYQTGDRASVIDDLLENLYWQAYNLHHDRGVSDILGLNKTNTSEDQDG
jgi:hypothetical protein